MIETADALKHIREINSWAKEASLDSGVSLDECYSDVVHAYLDAEISDDEMRKEILRMTGVGERNYGPW